MYETYWKLQEPAFSLAPDPRFLYLGESHEDALLLLHHFATRRNGFMRLTGDPGTGKSVLLRRLLQFRRDDLRSVLVSAGGDRSSISTRILRQLSEDGSESDLDGRLRALYELGRKVVVALDGWSRASAEDASELIRLARNHENVAILLAGPDGGSGRITTPSALEVRISGFKSEETAAMIQHRLRTAGFAGDEPPFTEEALAEVDALAAGNPRLAVQWADHALFYGFNHNLTRLDGAAMRSLERSLGHEAA
ncbi:MAG: hypothetical protein C4320_07865 [Armatimonadota bacterium]